MNTAQELLAAGDPQAALQALQQEVRGKSADPKLRIFLFQLLSLLGQWPRAMTQLTLCGEMDHGALAMVNTYREALKCEAVREAVFAGKTTPMVFGQPQEWVAQLVQALQADAQGNTAEAARLRSAAFDAAPTTAGTLNGEAFDWIADADSRLGPVLEAVINGRYSWVPFSALSKATLEAPTDLRDLIWTPAHLEFPNGGDTVALVPTRYVGSAADADGAVQMARKTNWIEMAPDQFRGLGQRVFSTSGPEVGVLQVRDIVLAGGNATTEAT